MTVASRQKAIYLLTDFLSANIAWCLFNIARYYILPQSSIGFCSLETFLCSKAILAGQILFAPLMLAIHWLSGYYNRIFAKSRLQELLSTIGSAVAGTFIVFFTALINDLSADRFEDYRLFVILLADIFIVTYIPRLVITSSASRKLRSGIISFPTLILGNESSDAEYESTEKRINTANGLRVVARADTSDNVELLCRELGIKAIVVIPHKDGIEATMPAIGRALMPGLPIYMSPHIAHLITSRPVFSDPTSEPLIDVSSPGISDSTRNMKRASDIALSSVALVVLAPIIAVLGIIIKYDSPGPVFYRQERLGIHGKPFNIYKLRSMRTDAESNGPTLSSPNDTRVTGVGKFLRKYRLDELPQFWNVLKGDMSLVGPRPERRHYVDEIIKKTPYYTLIQTVRPGITSWGMVRYGYASNVDEMIERMKYDLLYVRNVSFLVDMKILAHTVLTILTGKGI